MTIEPDKFKEGAVAVIPARGGSKGIVHKNIADCAGKPLIHWTLEAAQQAQSISHIIVSTDDDDIAAACEPFAVEVVARPPGLAQDDSAILPAIHQALTNAQSDQSAFRWLVLLQPTSPLRQAGHIDAAMSQLQHSEADALISVVQPDKHPLKAMRLQQGYLRGLVNDDDPFANRQQLPVCFYPNGAIYIVELDFFLQHQRLLTDKTLSYEMDWQSSLDIDQPEDLLTAAKVLVQQG